MVSDQLMRVLSALSMYARLARPSAQETPTDSRTPDTHDQSGVEALLYNDPASSSKLLDRSESNEIYSPERLSEIRVSQPYQKAQKLLAGDHPPLFLPGKDQRCDEETYLRQLITNLGERVNDIDPTSGLYKELVEKRESYALALHDCQVGRNSLSTVTVQKFK